MSASDLVESDQRFTGHERHDGK